MKNMSIRTKILAGVVLVNLIGAVIVSVYLHQTFSGGLDVTAQESVTLSVHAWDGIVKYGADDLEAITGRGAADYAQALKDVTGSDYGVLIAKDVLDQAAYEEGRAEDNLPSNWDERENYVLLASTDDTLEEEMVIEAPADSIPEIGKIVGLSNGSCSRTCHGTMTQEGDFWKVAWSKDDRTRAHTVFPIVEGGKTIGLVYSIQDISRQANEARSSVVNTLVVIVVGLVFATIVIAMLLNSLVFARLNKMMRSMEEISMRVAGGDFDAKYVPGDSNDEIGRFEKFFARYMELISTTLKSLVR